MKEQRVALVASSYHPHVGGVEEHVRNVAQELKARGRQVAVWSVDRGEHLGTRQIDGIEVRYLPAPLPAQSLVSTVRFLIDLPSAVVKWLRAFRALRPNVIHVQCFGPNGIYAYALARVTRTPFIVSSHGETFADDHSVYQRSWLLRVGLTRAIRGAAAVTGCSEFVTKDLRERFAAKNALAVPNGIDVHATAAGDRPSEGREPLVFAVGRLEWIKGFDLLLRAFALASLPKDARLVIGGNGRALSDLKNLARELKIDDNVCFPGTLGRQAVAQYMADAALVVVPSRWEAFGIVVLEAWRAGAPLIATSQGGPVHLVTHGVDGLVVDPEETGALAAAISRVLLDEAAARRLGVHGQMSVKEYTWHRTVDKYEDIYRGIAR